MSDKFNANAGQGHSTLYSTDPIRRLAFGSITPSLCLSLALPLSCGGPPIPVNAIHPPAAVAQGT